MAAGFFRWGVFAVSLWLIHAVQLDRSQRGLTTDLGVDLTGWTLVRRVKAGTTWHPAKDNCLGTESYGTPTTDPTAAVTFSLKFDQMDYNQLLFATGDGTKWVTVTRSEVEYQGGSNFLVDVVASHYSDTPYEVRWYNRPGQVGDPWISAKDHHTNGNWPAADQEVHSMLYGEDSYAAWFTWIKNHNGANVFVRKVAYPPYAGVDLNGWKLVRRVKPGTTWHPAKDNALGTESYGTPTTDFQAYSTFSIKYDQMDYNQLLFATGDGTKWIILSRVEVEYQGGSNYSVDVVASFVSPDKPSQVRMYNRPGQVGDPWLSAKDHHVNGNWPAADQEVHSMLYGEDGYQAWFTWIRRHNGGNVFIRKAPLAPYSGVDLSGWTLVRRVRAGRTWHPAKDNCLGTDSYGTPTTDFQADLTFSIKYDQMDYDQLLFATGDGTKWLIANRKQVESQGGSNFVADVVASFVTPDKPSQVRWYNRPGQVGDPWISAKDHHVNGNWPAADQEVHSMLYGEDGYQAWFTWIKNHNGANVFIRKSTRPPYTGVDLTGWQFVRRVQAGPTWHPATDNALGSQAYGTPTSDIQADATFSIKYDTLDFNQMLFTSGDGQKWVIVSRAQVAKQGGDNFLVDIIASHVSDKPYQARWYNRPGTPEDPWISARDHWSYNTNTAADTDEHSMLYGENKWNGWNNYIKNRNGANVFIRKVATPYTGVDLTGWKLVRRVKAGPTWHPATDNALGSQAYGEYTQDFQADATFSIKYDTLDFDQMLFASGDGQKWVIVSQAQVAKQGGDNFLVDIIASHVSDKPYQARWYNRPGTPEDPWISARDHWSYNTNTAADTDEHSMLYGENKWNGWNNYIKNRNGANVFIRKAPKVPTESSYVPPPPQEGGYTPQESAYVPPSEGGYTPGTPSEGGYTPGYTPGNGDLPPPPPDAGGYTPSEGGYTPSEGGYTPGYTPSEGGYTPSEGGYTPSEGGYTPGYTPSGGTNDLPPPPPPLPPGGGEGGYTPSDGYTPSEGGYVPNTGYTPESAYVPPPPSSYTPSSYTPSSYTPSSYTPSSYTPSSYTPTTAYTPKKY